MDTRASAVVIEIGIQFVMAMALSRSMFQLVAIFRGRYRSELGETSILQAYSLWGRVGKLRNSHFHSFACELASHIPTSR